MLTIMVCTQKKGNNIKLELKKKEGEKILGITVQTKSNQYDSEVWVEMYVK